MSNYSDTNVSGPTSGEAPGSSGTLGTAKSEASDLAHTAGDEAKGVVDAAKTEATSVAQEAKSQAKDLFAQSQQELKDQARTQQQRVASGLQTVGGDLQSMADGAASDSLAADLVRQVSGRISSASAWLSDREPADVLDEVKRFARRRTREITQAVADHGGWLTVNDGEGERREALLFIGPGVPIAVVPIPDPPETAAGGA